MAAKFKSNTQRMRDRHEAAQEGFKVEDLITDRFVLRCTGFKDVQELLSAAGVDSLSDLSGAEYMPLIEQHFKCSDYKSLIKQAIMLRD